MSHFFYSLALKESLSRALLSHSRCKSSLFSLDGGTEWRRLLIRRVSTFRPPDRSAGKKRGRKGGMTEGTGPSWWASPFYLHGPNWEEKVKDSVWTLQLFYVISAPFSKKTWHLISSGAPLSLSAGWNAPRSTGRREVPPRHFKTTWQLLYCGDVTPVFSSQTLSAVLIHNSQ